MLCIDIIAYLSYKYVHPIPKEVPVKRKTLLQFALFLLPSAFVGWWFHLFDHIDLYLGTLLYWLALGIHIQLIESYYGTQRLFLSVFTLLRFTLRGLAILSLAICAYTIIMGALTYMRDNEVPLRFVVTYTVATPLCTLEMRATRRFIVNASYRLYRQIIWATSWIA